MKMIAGVELWQQHFRMRWVFHYSIEIDHTVETWNQLRERVRDAGRNVADFGAEYVVPLPVEAGDLTAEVDAWAKAGGTHISLATMGRGLSSVEAHIDSMAAAAKALGLG